MCVAFLKDLDLGMGILWSSPVGTVKGARADYGQTPEAVVAEASALFLTIYEALDMNLSKILLVLCGSSKVCLYK